MQADSIADPLTSPAPAEVPLPSAPLARVVAQVRFPEIVSIERREFIGPFQEAIRRDYPALRAERAAGVILGPGGVVQPQASSTTWRFNDRSEAWRVSLTPGFVALETTEYTSREDFLERMRRLLYAVEEHVDPQIADRLGIRYIDRIAWSGPEAFARLVRPDVAGILARPFGDSATQVLTQCVFELPESDAALMARWGLVPAGGTIDPSVLEPADSACWILDLDAHSPSRQAFDVNALLAQTGALAERVYTFFRWAVTDQFLTEFGGVL